VIAATTAHTEVRAGVRRNGLLEIWTERVVLMKAGCAADYGYVSLSGENFVKKL
jgi:hypothetical protein